MYWENKGKLVPTRDLLSAVRKDVDAHVNRVEQSDDITMLAVCYKG